MPRSLCSVLATLSAALMAVSTVTARAEPAGCVTDTVGFTQSDAESATEGFQMTLGAAVGQTFRAFETTITRITAWRARNDIDFVGTHLTVTGVDTTKTPPQPVTQAILQDGPTVLVHDSDPPETSSAWTSSWIPRSCYRAPAPMFFQRAATPLSAGSWRIRRPHPYGILRTPPSRGGCFVRSVEGGDGERSLFQIEFCRRCRRDATPHVGTVELLSVIQERR